MINKTIIIGAVVILAIAGGYAFYTQTGIGDNEFPLGVSDDLSVEGKIDISLTFADGSTKTVTGKAGDPLEVTYDGQTVQQATWKLSAKASTPAGAEAWENCDINYAYAPDSNMDYFNLDVLVYADLDEDSVPDQNGFVWTQEWYPTAAGPVEMVTIPVDSGQFHPIVLYTITFDEVFTGQHENGKYVLQFNPDGYSTYRGSSAHGEGEWKEIDFTGTEMISAYPIYYAGADATVIFDSEVIWG